MLQTANGAPAEKALLRDPATTQLGAWTDAGTVYYRPDAGTNMSDILPRWIAALRAEHIPVRCKDLATSERALVVRTRPLRIVTRA